MKFRLTPDPCLPSNWCHERSESFFCYEGLEAVFNCDLSDAKGNDLYLYLGKRETGKASVKISREEHLTRVVAWDVIGLEHINTTFEKKVLDYVSEGFYSIELRNKDNEVY